MSEIDRIRTEFEALERAIIEPNLSLDDLLNIKKQIRGLRKKTELIIRNESNKLMTL